jgi:hypothetical protein
MRLNQSDEAESALLRATELDHYLEAARTKLSVLRDRLKRRKQPPRPKTPPSSGTTADARATRPPEDSSSLANTTAQAEPVPEPDDKDDNER